MTDTFRASLDALQRVQKTSKGAPAYSRLVNRPLGRVFAAAANVVGATPDTVTAIGAAFTFTGIGLIALVEASPATSVAVMLCLLLGYALDAADGQLARLRGGGSVAGEWLDHVVDAVKIACLHTSVLVNWYRFEDPSDRRLLIPIAFQIVASTIFFVMILNDRIRRAQRGNLPVLTSDDAGSSTVYSIAVIPADYGLLCLCLGLMWWSGFVWLYGLLLAANAAFVVVALGRWFAEMRHY